MCLHSEVALTISQKVAQETLKIDLKARKRSSQATLENKPTALALQDKPAEEAEGFSAAEQAKLEDFQRPELGRGRRPEGQGRRQSPEQRAEAPGQEAEEGGPEAAEASGAEAEEEEPGAARPCKQGQPLPGCSSGQVEEGQGHGREEQNCLGHGPGECLQRPPAAGGVAQRRAGSGAEGREEPERQAGRAPLRLVPRLGRPGQSG